MFVKSINFIKAINHKLVVFTKPNFQKNNILSPFWLIWLEIVVSIDLSRKQWKFFNFSGRKQVFLCIVVIVARNLLLRLLKYVKTISWIRVCRFYTQIKHKQTISKKNCKNKQFCKRNHSMTDWFNMQIWKIWWLIIKCKSYRWG